MPPWKGRWLKSLGLSSIEESYPNLQNYFELTIAHDLARLKAAQAN